MKIGPASPITTITKRSIFRNTLQISQAQPTPQNCPLLLNWVDELSKNKWKLSSLGWVCLFGDMDSLGLWGWGGALGHRQGPQILFLCSTPIFCVAPDRSYSFPDTVRGPTHEMVCQQWLLDQIPLQKTRAPRHYCCSVAKLGPTCWDPMEYSKPGLLVPHHLPYVKLTISNCTVKLKMRLSLFMHNYFWQISCWTFTSTLLTII